MDKILTASQIQKVASRLRHAGRKIVFTNGTFDFLHLGHVTYLQKARALGDCLIVGINSDSSVRSYKGPGRPVNPQADRMRVMAALQCVDYVVMFNTPTPLGLIRKIRPHVLVKGADWKKHQIAGAQEVESWGGKVKLVAMVSGRSTTRLIKKLEKALR